MARVGDRWNDGGYAGESRAQAQRGHARVQAQARDMASLSTSVGMRESKQVRACANGTPSKAKRKRGSAANQPRKPDLARNAKHKQKHKEQTKEGRSL